MARIRSLKPETASDKKLASVSRDARYTFLLLISQADDDGLFRAEGRQLLGALYPFDDDVTPTVLEVWLAELVRIGALRWRETRDGVRVGELVNWSRHQLIKNRSKPFLLTQLVPVSEKEPEPSGAPTESLPPVSVESGGAESRVLSLESGVLSPENTTATQSAAPADEDVSRETTEPENDEARKRREHFEDGQIMVAIRRHLYAPDGKPPAGWDEGREFTIMRRLRKAGKSTEQIITAIEGLIPLSQDGHHDYMLGKKTLRLLITENGCLDGFNEAEDAYYKQGQTTKRPKGFRRQANDPVGIGELVAALPQRRPA